ncbi:MAG: hypothetical protein PWQ10_320 [Patescibacteria group bacterium]|nr:hypothetical protein [Patescibacteria group bacterium]
MGNLLKKGIIIAGFAGIGKTTLAKKYKNVIDIESSYYKWDNTGLEYTNTENRKGIVLPENPNWPNNYINKIKEAQLMYDIVLVWVHPDALDIYDKEKLEYIIIYPSKDSLSIYKQRYYNRGNTEKYISRIIDTYDMRKRQFDKKNAQKVILENDETLEDYLIKNDYYLEDAV